MRRLYVLSKPIKNKPRLIGELTESNGEYTFRYRLGRTLPEWFLLIEEFPDVNRTYYNMEVKTFTSRLIPRKNSRYIDMFLREAGLQTYDEWELLKRQGRFNARQDAYLFEELPNEVIIYDYD